METIHVQSRTHSYPVYIGENIRFHVRELLPKNYSSIFVITDQNVEHYYLADVLTALTDHNVYHASITPGESSKSLDVFHALHTAALSHHLDRNALIIALGGGVVGDVAGFVAATYMRGIDYIQMPTTILAHDSSIGGKVGINHAQGKNLIGSFYPPVAVVYDVDTLNTIRRKDVRSGYAELIKEALISDEVFFDQLLKSQLYTSLPKDITSHLTTGITIKSSIVEQDEREAGNRVFLNLGHTLGHAIERESGYGKYAHGEAVAIGLLFALFVSQNMFKVALPFERLFRWMHTQNYPLNFPHRQLNTYIQTMKSDKKTSQAVVQMVLLEAIGKPVTKPISDEDLYQYLQSFMTVLDDLKEGDCV
ncbi:3-dehydroquinate synthase [Lentibacillus saliphilus]|uniref:3-dehydroquinate synthase n=1 Tax=Lentibacillus saliphilus TaxID=2737028 RepID=UPI001C30AC1F|nr:3-dehydroquinate synthase [Lentibacillus saliphilus]